MSKKLTYDEVKNRFNKKGYELISTEYINSNTKLQYICSQHKDRGIQTITISNLTKCGCYWCGLEKRSSKRRLSYKEVKNEFDRRGFKLVSNNYINSRVKLKFICPKHGLQENDWNHFKASKGNGCPQCGIEIRAKKRTIDFSVVKQEFDKRGYILVSKTYSADTKLKYICPKHKNNGIQEIAWGKFYYMKQGCPYCYGNIRKTTEQFKQEVFELVGDEYEVLGEYVNALSYIKLKHNECGHVWDINASSFLRGRRCPRCAGSNGEKAIIEYLTENNIEFLPQYRFEDCRSKRPLPFDFYLLDYNMLIEYDGEQHFKLTRFKNNKEILKRNQKHDKIKNTYCLKNNIPLLRIPYWEFDNIADILNQALFNNDSAFLIA